MKFTFVLVIGVLLLSSPEFAQSSARHFFEQGNTAYREGNYQEAIQHYQAVLNTGFESSQVYYNLGNCYYKLDQIGRAILYYEKALRIDPNDPDIRLNLEIANLKTADRLETPPKFFLFAWWDSLKRAFSQKELTYLLLGFYILSILLVIAWLFLRFHRRRGWVVTLLSISATLTVLWAYLLISSIQAESQQRSAIVLPASVSVLSAPEENSTDVFILHAGVKVSVEEQRGEWMKIRLPDGKSGWLRSEYLGVI